MQFTSYEFAFFFMACFAVSWSFLSRNHLRKWVLLFCSYLFVTLVDWRLAGLLFAATCFNYLLGHLLGGANSAVSKRFYSFLAITANILLFISFKYFGFFTDAITPFLTEAGFDRDIFWVEFAMPIGLSFFILQAVSYLVDIHRGKVIPEDSFLNYQLLMVFFPKIIAGPLVKADEFLPQFKEQASLTRDMVGLGLLFILMGLAKKIIIADMLAVNLVDPVFTDPIAFSAFDVLIAVYALSIQLYCDISGYCDLAIGCSLLLGIRLSQNFDRPYSARNLIEFWGRWYKSLTGFFVDYVYKPMGGQDGGIISAGRNLVLTFLIAAWWHGTSLTFLAFAFLHSICLCGSYLFVKFSSQPVTHAVSYGSAPIGQYISYGDKGLRIAGPVISTCITFHIVCLGWLLFRSEDLGVVSQLFKSIAAGDMTIELLTPYLAVLMIGAFTVHFMPKDMWLVAGKKLSRFNSIALGLLFGLGILVIQILASPSTQPFFYQTL